VYVQPRPVFVQPAPLYLRPPVFVAPREVFKRSRCGGNDARSEWKCERVSRRAVWRRQQVREEFRGGDRDHNGRMHHHDYRD